MWINRDRAERRTLLQSIVDSLNLLLGDVWADDILQKELELRYPEPEFVPENNQWGPSEERALFQHGFWFGLHLRHELDISAGSGLGYVDYQRGADPLREIYDHGVSFGCKTARKYGSRLMYTIEERRANGHTTATD